jgi:hypothetical protein
MGSKGRLRGFFVEMARFLEDSEIIAIFTPTLRHIVLRTEPVLARRKLSKLG